MTGWHRWLLMSALLPVAAIVQGVEPRGIIEATIDGERVRWKSFSTPAGPGAMWRTVAEGRGSLAVGGFEETDVPVDDPGWIGSQIAINVDFALDGEQVSHRLPAVAGQQVSLHIIPRASNYRHMHTLREGTVSIARMVGGDADSLRFEGTFSGTLVDDDGEVVGTVSDGRFTVEDVARARRAP